MKKFLNIALFTALTLMSADVFAQTGDNDNISADANVVAAVDVVAETNLDFGSILTSSSSAVAANAGTPGKFTVTSTSGIDLSLSFAMPDAGNGCNSGTYTYCLLRSGGSNTVDNDLLELTFGANDGAWDNTETATNGSGGTTFNPTAGATTGGTQDGNIAVFVGGTVTSTGTQAQGSYTGTITLTVDYN